MGDRTRSDMSIDSGKMRFLIEIISFFLDFDLTNSAS